MLIIVPGGRGNELRKVRDQARKPWNLSQDSSALERIHTRLDRLTLHCRALWSIVSEQYEVSEEALSTRMESLSNSTDVSACTGCGRPVACTQRACLYCGERNASFGAGSGDSVRPDAAAAALMGAAITAKPGSADADRFQKIEARIDRIALVYSAIWSFVAEKHQISEKQLAKRVDEMVIDGGVSGACKECGRTFAARQPKCVYCGAVRADASLFDSL